VQFSWSGFLVVLRSQADLPPTRKHKISREARNLLGSALNPWQNFGI